MANYVPNSPALPIANGRQDTADLARFNTSQNVQLIGIFSEYAIRLNGALMKDGTEAMTGKLDIGLFPFVLGSFAVADFPDATTNRGAIIYSTDDNLIYVSDGITWSAIPMSSPVTDGFNIVNIKHSPYNAVGDGNNDDGVIIQQAIDDVEADGGGITYGPPGSYYCPSGIIISADGTSFQGAGQFVTNLLAKDSDVTVVTLNSVGSIGRSAALLNVTVFGKGMVDGTFGATKSAVVIKGVSQIIRDCTIWGGLYALDAQGHDCFVDHVDLDYSYGDAILNVSGNNFYERGKYDHNPTGIATTTVLPFPAWSGLSGYNAGDIVTIGSYNVQCKTAGTTAAASPALKNYSVEINDGTVVWLLIGKSNLCSVRINHGAGENHFTTIDLSGTGLVNSLVFDNTAGSNGPGVTYINQSIFSGPISIEHGANISITDCELGADINIDTSYAGGQMTINDNYSTGAAVDINVGADVGDFHIISNKLAGGTITTAAGTGDHYVIAFNLRTTVVDNAAGGNATVTGNH